MSTASLTDLLTYAEPVACLTVLGAMGFRNQLRSFKALAIYLCVRLLSIGVMLPVYAFGMERHYFSPKLAYHIYFSTYWSSYALEAVLGFCIILGVFRLAMDPLPGLRRLGMLMFRWAAGISICLAAAMAFTPHASGQNYLIHMVSQLQQIQSVLTLCMLFFVCLAIRPMGLKYNSKIFGTSLGLGVMAAADLIASAWFSTFPGTSQSTVSVANGLAILVALSIWTAYHIAPEPHRRMIIMPTTSPFLRWNQISDVLGDAPGYVALGAVTPDMLAPAELEIMRRAAAKIPQAVAV